MLILVSLYFRMFSICLANHNPAEVQSCRVQQYLQRLHPVPPAFLSQIRNVSLVDMFYWIHIKMKMLLCTLRLCPDWPGGERGSGIWLKVGAGDLWGGGEEEGAGGPLPGLNQEEDWQSRRGLCQNLKWSDYTVLIIPKLIIFMFLLCLIKGLSMKCCSLWCMLEVDCTASDHNNYNDEAENEQLIATTNIRKSLITYTKMLTYNWLPQQIRGWGW